jgi:hypothetical protein
MLNPFLSSSVDTSYDDRKPPVPAFAHSEEASESLTRSLRVVLDVVDRDVIDELERHGSLGDRHEYALAALRIGCIALRQVQSKVDVESLRQEGNRLILDMEQRVRAEANNLQKTLSDALKEYFDPQGGKFQDRVERLIRKDGDLESLLQRQIGGQEDSALARTLTAHVGHHSPIMKRLDPAQAESVTEAMRATVSDVLTTQRQTILSEFSLDKPESALNRFRQELMAGNQSFTGDLKAQIATAIREFSLDDEDSALSRLVKKVEEAQARIAKEFSLDDDGSALSRMSQSLDDAKQAINRNLTLDATDSPLSRLKRELETVLKEQTDANNKFQMEVREALSALVSKRAESKRSTIHGIEFEEAVCQVIEDECKRAGDIASRVGTDIGAVARSKVGDQVIEIGSDHVAGGCKIVIEAKEAGSYTIARAKTEMEEARKNREAQVGIFVFSAAAASERLDNFCRHRNDIFVVWDRERPETDVYLKAAISVAKALCAREATAGTAQAADFKAIDQAISSLEKQVETAGEIETAARLVGQHNEKVLNKLGSLKKAIENQAEVLRDKVGELRSLYSPVAL